uniref:Protein UL49 n=1 Tax=Hipposideros bat herpesvirus TaxID=3141919 RepID=A0AAU7E031_9VIRU
MSSFSDVVFQLMSPLCRHDDNYHTELILSGCRRNKAKSCSAAGDSFCVLTIFLTDKRFLSRDQVDRYYGMFAAVWLNGEGKDSVDACRRIVMTRSLFMFVCYMYLLRVMCDVSKNVAVFGPCTVSWDDLERKMHCYPREKLDVLLENVNMQQLNDMHRYLLNADLRIPIPTQVSSPCMSILRSKEYDRDLDMPVIGNTSWIRNRVRTRDVGYVRLVESLKRNTGSSLSGNPMYTLARVMIERFCRSSRRFLLPMGKRSFFLNPGTWASDKSHEVSPVSGKGHAVPSKILSFALSVSLRNGIISSVVDLPVTCYCKAKCQRYAAPGSLLATVCRNCGHCLNLGKERLACGPGFPLNSMFYYRDRQEKNVVHSTHGELAHCSLCGSQYLDTECIYGVTRDGTPEFPLISVSWRAVTGSNSACAVYDNDSPFDIIVPCSSRTCYSTVVLRKISVDRLLRLVSHGSEFLCQLCQNTYRETCVDEEGADQCDGCLVLKLFGCNQRHVNISRGERPGVGE